MILRETVDLDVALPDDGDQPVRGDLRVSCYHAGVLTQHFAIDQCRSHDDRVVHFKRCGQVFDDCLIERIDDAVLNVADVCEHIPEPDLASILGECARLLRPGGLVSFRIDLTDHYSYFDRSLSTADDTEPVLL